LDEANSLADQLRDKNVSLETRVGILEKELSACTQIQVSVEEKVKNLESDLKNLAHNSKTCLVDLKS